AAAPGPGARGRFERGRADVRGGAHEGGPGARAAPHAAAELPGAVLALPAWPREERGMRLRLGAAAGAAIVLVGILGSPTLPVMIGATLAYAWLLWRAVGARSGASARRAPSGDGSSPSRPPAASPGALVAAVAPPAAVWTAPQREAHVIARDATPETLD